MTPYEDSLLRLVHTDERLVIMTAENRAPIKELIPLIPGRFVDVGIAEQTLIGMAAGLALRGRRPIVHALSAFLTMRSFEFIRTDIGISGLPVVMVGYVPGFLSDANGPTHQAIEDIGLMRLVPSVNVFCPSDQQELAEALPEILLTEEPWYIRYLNTNGTTNETGVHLLKIGKPNVVHRGFEICILSYGVLLGYASRAASLLERSGISVQVVNVHTLKPIDTDFLEDCLAHFAMVVIVEDHFRLGGLSSIVAETVAQCHRRIESTGSRVAAIVPLTLGDRWFKPTLFKDVLQWEGFTAEALAARIMKQFKHEVSYA